MASKTILCRHDIGYNPKTHATTVVFTFSDVGDFEEVALLAIVQQYCEAHRSRIIPTLKGLH